MIITNCKLESQTGKVKWNGIKLENGMERNGMKWNKATFIVIGGKKKEKKTALKNTKAH